MFNVNTDVPLSVSRQVMRSTSDIWKFAAGIEQEKLEVTPVVVGNGEIHYYDKNNVRLTEQYCKPVLRYIGFTDPATKRSVRIENIIYVYLNGTRYHPRGQTAVCAMDFHDSFAVRENGGKPYPYHKGRYIR